MYKHLTREQRYAIYLGKQRGETLEMIARSIGVHKSTVSREVCHNSTPSGRYIWNKAHDMAESRLRHSPGNRFLSAVLKWRIIELIKTEQWSPRQISGRLGLDGISVSHETIYAIIRREESGELASQCRHKMKYRRKASRRHETKATNIRNCVSIHQRPAEADGKRLGDWEMDLIVDKDSNAILTLTERSTNFLLMEKLKQGKKAGPVAKAVWRLLLPYKGQGGEVHNNGQRQRVLRTRMDNQEIERTCVFCRLLLRMAERSHRKRQQVDTTIHSKRDGHQHRYRAENRQDQEENQRQAKGKTQFF